MYDVMIIDDDEYIRDRLKSIIEWDKIGLRLACEAADSDTARELFLLHRPKILVTDINIPIISGLELAQEIAALDAEVRFIVITGYSDFEYVKGSVKLGAVDLISKPISPSDINASLKKAAAYFDKLKEEQKSLKNMQLLLEESLPMIREKFVSFIMNQIHKYSPDKIREKFASLGLDIIGNYYTVALISPSIDALSAEETDLALVTVKDTSDELLRSAGYKVYSFYDSNYRLNCLLSWSSENGGELLEETIQKIHEKLGFYWGINIYAGIGMPVTDISVLQPARHEAYIALNYQGVLESGPVIAYSNIERLDKPMDADNSKVIAHAVMCFKNSDLTGMRDLIKNELAGMLVSSADNMEPVRKFVFEFISTIIAQSISLGININMISKYSDIYSKIFSFSDIHSLMQYLFSFTESISSELSNKRSNNKNMLILMAKEFINKNLANEKLNLELVSRHIGLSPIYFCKLFHKEEGVSFNDYLNLARINKAKTLLGETNLKVFEVSCATGFGNSPYFYYVFKRLTGVTPLEYRNSFGRAE